MKIIYPSPEKIIEHNLLVLNILKVKKADKAEVLSYQKLVKITEGCESLEGGIYDKAIYLLKNIIQKHTFASGNRRTAFITTKYFLHHNKAVLKIKDENLNDKKLYEKVSKTLKSYGVFLDTKNSEREFFRELKKFYKLIEGHKKLLTAIGKL